MRDVNKDGCQDILNIRSNTFLTWKTERKEKINPELFNHLVKKIYFTIFYIWRISILRIVFY